jgi:RNA polymerase sigma-70 factor (ECF subfamily)
MIADEATLSMLLARARAGDAECYTVLLRETARWLERYFRRRIPPAELDDLVQDTLVSVHRKLASHDPERAFLPWLAAIARYRWVDHLRRAYRAERTGLEADGVTTGEDDVVLARVSVARLLTRLSPVQAEAIALVKIEGLSVADAAARSGQSVSAIKVNIHRGLRRLAAMVEEAD